MSREVKPNFVLDELRFYDITLSDSDIKKIHEYSKY